MNAKGDDSESSLVPLILFTLPMVKHCVQTSSQAERPDECDSGTELSHALTESLDGEDPSWSLHVVYNG